MLDVQRRNPPLQLVHDAGGHVVGVHAVDVRPPRMRHAAVDREREPPEAHLRDAQAQAGRLER
jgi:hypothetical protein